jgi:Ion channel
MLIRLLQSAVLLAVTVTFHTFVLSLLLRHAERYVDEVRLTFATYAWLLVSISALAVLAHLIEIALWAAFYYWKGALPDFLVSFYFSAVTYATIGYGDVVLPETWRLTAAIEGLTGILMCGWSAAFFFAVVSHIYGRTRPSKADH